MVSRNCKIAVFFTAFIILFCAFPAQVANAQETPHHSDMIPLLEEVVVTARKREESVFDAPLSVSALRQGDAVECSGPRNLVATVR